jgi:uncharacterized membrane-anchored protein YhcB (DUF1043 family)
MMHFPQLSLRTKLILSFLIVIGGIISLIFGSRLIKNTLISQAKVNHDLASARMVFNEKLNDVSDIVSLTAARISPIKDDDKRENRLPSRNSNGPMRSRSV